MRSTSPTMDRSESLIIQEGGSVEYHRGKQTPFEPTATVKIGMGGYSIVYKVVIPTGHFRYKTESNTSIKLNEVSYLPASIYISYS
jgi:hypothetical protein